MVTAALAIALAAAAGAQDPAPGAREPEPGATVAALVPCRDAAVHLGGRPVTILVCDRGAGADETLRALAIARLGLPEIAHRAGFAPTLADDAVVLHLWTDRERTGGYRGGNDGHRIDLCAPLEPRVVLHELAHHWYGQGFVRDPLARERWIVEGLCELIAIATLEALPALAERASAHAETLAVLDPTAARLGMLAEPPEYPLPPGRSGATASWYASTYLFFHLLAARFGEDRLLAAATAFSARPEPGDSDAFLAELAQLDPALPELASGWLDDGPFHPEMTPELGRDTDRDGLSDAEERALGTDPAAWDGDRDGVGDGAEVRVRGSDPRAADPGRAYWIDGDPADWAIRRQSMRVGLDRTGDATTGRASDDVRAVRVDADDLWLYALFELAGPPDASAVLELGIDQGGDETFEVVVSARPGAEVSVLQRRPDTDRFDVVVRRLAELAVDGVAVELAVPLSALGLEDPRGARLYAYSGLGAVDHVPGWLAFPAW